MTEQPTNPKRKSDPNWRKRPSQNPDRWAKTNAAVRKRRNEMARALGFPNSGALLSAIEIADEETKQQIALLLASER